MFLIKYEKHEAIHIIATDSIRAVAAEMGTASAAMGVNGYEARKYGQIIADFIIDGGPESLNIAGVTLTPIKGVSVAEWEAKHFPQPAAEQQ